MASISSWMVDCSNWQASVNWEAVLSDGYHGGIVKATEGTTFRDAWFPRNWSELARLGAIRGAYAFARPSRGPAIPDADVFVDYVLGQGPLLPGDILVLDMEDTEFYGDVSEWCLDWLLRVLERTGCDPWLYSGAWYMTEHGLWTNVHLGSYPLWYASYISHLPEEMYAPPPPAWAHSGITLWQYTSSAAVPGVAGDCDSNASDLAPAELRALGYGAPAPGPTPPRDQLDALWAAEQACEPVYTSPADSENLTGIRAHISAIKGRYGYP